MFTTLLHPGGEVEVSEFPPRSVLPINVYLWREDTGWKSWVNNPEVENGGYWRTVNNDDLIAQLDVLKAQALESQQQREAADEPTTDSEKPLPE